MESISIRQAHTVWPRAPPQQRDGSPRTTGRPMDKYQVASTLAEIATLLELQGENPFRCNAYHNAARAIEQLEEDLGEVVRAGRLKDIPGIGQTLHEKIATLVTTGELPFYNELKAKTPPGLLQMLRLPGVGPKKVKALYEQLDIKDL